MLQAGILTLKTSIIKGGVDKFDLKQPIFMPGPMDPQYSSRLIFQGISVEVSEYPHCLLLIESALSDSVSLRASFQTETERSTRWTLPCKIACTSFF